MVVVKSGVTPSGEVYEHYIDENLKRNLDEVKRVVGTKSKKGMDWDYICIVAGMPGVGKSNFAQNIARYCCEWFDENYIAFTSEDFISLTNNCPTNSAIILDESFASLNAKVSRSTDFLKIINHLQLIRQKNLYIFLCLPNFFDLAKGIAVYRSHHLFVTYSPEFGKRGSFGAWSRQTKKMLYIKGQKFMDYGAENPNFRGRFTKCKCINTAKYERKKRSHLMDQELAPETMSKASQHRDKYIMWFTENTKLKHKKIAQIGGLTERTIGRIVAKNRGGEKLWNLQEENKKN